MRSQIFYYTRLLYRPLWRTLYVWININFLNYHQRVVACDDSLATVFGQDVVDRYAALLAGIYP